jgi:hypothetical protein
MLGIIVSTPQPKPKSRKPELVVIICDCNDLTVCKALFHHRQLLQIQVQAHRILQSHPS